MRINKYLALCELGSRRKVEEYITEGLVSVNNEIITDLSFQVNEDDIVKFNNIVIKPQTNKVYIMLNKPTAYLSSAVNQGKMQSVLNLLPNVKERIFPVGRLDYNTEGLLLLTNDGEFANKIITPKFEIEKEYEVVFKNKPTNQQLTFLTGEIVLDDQKIRPAIINNLKVFNEQKNLYYLTITIHEGKNRQIRKMFEMAKLKIISLKRIRIGKLLLGKLKTGQYKKLNEQEIKLIFEK